MPHTAEEMAAVLKSKPSIFSLENDMPIFSEGIADMVTRLKALEDWRKAMSAPATPEPSQP